MYKEPTLLNKIHRGKSPRNISTQNVDIVNKPDGLSDSEAIAKVDYNSASRLLAEGFIKYFSQRNVLLLSILLLLIFGGIFVLNSLKSNELINIDELSNSQYEADRNQALVRNEFAKRYRADSPYPPAILKTDDVALEIDAKAFAIYDNQGFRNYATHNADERLQIASITKLMTAIIVYEEYDLSAELANSRPLPDELEYLLKWEVGDKITVDEALTTILVSSFNDVAYLLAAEYPDGGYEGFIKEMNNRAESYGMRDTSFGNSYGFDHPDNYSTVNDLRILIYQFLRHEDLAKRSGMGAFDVSIFKPDGGFESRRIYSTNYLIGRNSGVMGLKTGSTALARFCFVGYFILPNGQKIVTILLGSESDRFQETEKLVQYRIDKFE